MPSRITPRKPGGQPGNLNAAKHGFYSKFMQQQELVDLEATITDGLTDEIAMLRVVIRRAFDLAGQQTNPLRMAETLSTLGAACTRLGSLMRTQKLLAGKETSSMDVLSQALKEVSDELGIK